MTEGHGISTGTIESLTGKLHAFAEGLEAEERAALDLVLTRASGPEEGSGPDGAEVHGFDATTLRSMNVGLQFLDLSRTQTSLRSSLLRTFSSAAGAPWE
jgi:hypothetical protein